MIKPKMLWYLIGSALLVVLGAMAQEQIAEAQAQPSPTIAARQVVALEKIASEMSRMRREKCR